MRLIEMLQANGGALGNRSRLHIARSAGLRSCNALSDTLDLLDGRERRSSVERRQIQMRGDGRSYVRKRGTPAN